MPAQGPAKHWVIEGKYTDKWEQVDEVHPQTGAPRRALACSVSMRSPRRTPSTGSAWRAASQT